MITPSTGIKLLVKAHFNNLIIGFSIKEPHPGRTLTHEPGQGHQLLPENNYDLSVVSLKAFGYPFSS